MPDAPQPDAQLLEDDVLVLLRAPHLSNRLAMLLAHTSRYAFEGQARLARDVGVSRSTVSRLMRGKTKPNASLVRKVTEALGIVLNGPLSPRDVFSPDGTYPTPSGCELCHCPGCIPEYAFDRFGERRDACLSMQPGDWTLSPQSAMTRNQINA